MRVLRVFLAYYWYLARFSASSGDRLNNISSDYFNSNRNLSNLLRFFILTQNFLQLITSQTWFSSNLSRPDVSAVNIVNQQLDIKWILQVYKSISSGQSFMIPRNYDFINLNKLFAKFLNFMRISVIWNIHKVDSPS